MLSLPRQSYIGWQLSLGLLQGLALGACAFRLSHRFRAKKGWWDDYVLIVPMLLDTFFIGLYFVRFHTRVDQSLPPTRLEQILSSYWLTDLFLITITWSTKLVLCLSLVRILPLRSSPRRWCLGLAALMTLSWVSSAVTSAATCKQQTLLFPGKAGQHCTHVGRFPFKRIYFETNNLIATLALTLVCLTIFTRADISLSERRFVFSVFGASLCIFILAALVASISLNKDVLLGSDNYMLLASLEQTEAATSLLMANLSMLIALVRKQVFGAGGRDIAWDNDVEDDFMSEAGSASHSCTERSLTPITLTEISVSNYSISSHPSERFSEDIHCRSLASLKIEGIEPTTGSHSDSQV